MALERDKLYRLPSTTADHVSDFSRIPPSILVQTSHATPQLGPPQLNNPNSWSAVLSLDIIMIPHVFHSQLRTSLPRSLRRQLTSKLFTRLQATHQSPRTPNDGIQWSNPKGNIPVVPRRNTSPAQHSKATAKQRMTGESATL